MVPAWSSVSPYFPGRLRTQWQTETEHSIVITLCNQQLPHNNMSKQKNQTTDMQCSSADSPVSGAAPPLDCRGATGSQLAVHPGVWRTKNKLSDRVGHSPPDPRETAMKVDTVRLCCTAKTNNPHKHKNSQIQMKREKKQQHTQCRATHTQWAQPATLTSSLRV